MEVNYKEAMSKLGYTKVPRTALAKKASDNVDLEQLLDWIKSKQSWPKSIDTVMIAHVKAMSLSDAYEYFVGSDNSDGGVLEEAPPIRIPIIPDAIEETDLGISKSIDVYYPLHTTLQLIHEINGIGDMVTKIIEHCMERTEDFLLENKLCNILGQIARNVPDFWEHVRAKGGELTTLSNTINKAVTHLTSLGRKIDFNLEPKMWITTREGKPRW